MAASDSAAYGCLPMAVVVAPATGPADPTGATPGSAGSGYGHESHAPEHQR
ncbi:MAG TPA: hypothetical protein VFU43_18680 [Streptosporangiaceae bacterium]|nr:hypothetical protein [Streptosporangiaceae bacterium]